MKTFAIAALLGLVTFSQVESVQCEFIGHKKRMAILDNLIQIENEESESDSDSASDDENVQLDANKVDYSEVGAYMDKSDAHGGYNRVVPDRFTEERDDTLMRSVIENYAREIKVNGSLTGVMMMNLADCTALAAEVKRTHKHMGYES